MQCSRINKSGRYVIKHVNIDSIHNRQQPMINVDTLEQSKFVKMDPLMLQHDFHILNIQLSWYCSVIYR
ncbi:hypothetical protein DERF_001839 [Dermatophagoides farinae]|uniref:Uncharacterized protein n=1 Tax=Dermatophagoides farinae TaxID=6954 RepID=A0A922LBH8_DERFA|nr:hypothetical protein DERF_001839 [Dermatophagoides farinae]